MKYGQVGLQVFTQGTYYLFHTGVDFSLVLIDIDIFTIKSNLQIHCIHGLIMSHVAQDLKNFQNYQYDKTQKFFDTLSMKSIETQIIKNSGSPIVQITTQTVSLLVQGQGRTTSRFVYSFQRGVSLKEPSMQDHDLRLHTCGRRVVTFNRRELRVSFALLVQ